MSGQNDMGYRKPCTAARGVAWVLALLLTLGLALGAGSLLLKRVVTNRGLHEGIALREEVLAEEMALVREKAEELAEEYHFSAELITAQVTEETLRELNRATIAWWTGMAETGRVEDMPQWDGSALQDALTQDPAFGEGQFSTLVKQRAGVVVSEVRETLKKAVFPLREEVLVKGMNRVASRVDLTGIARLMMGLPAMLGLWCLLLSGGIVFLLARDSRRIPRCLGGAFGGAALLCLLGLFLVKALNLAGMTGESSLRLARQVGLLESSATLEALLAVAVFAVFGVLLLWLGGNRKGAKGEAA